MEQARQGSPLDVNPEGRPQGASINVITIVIPHPEMRHWLKSHLVTYTKSQ